MNSKLLAAVAVSLLSTTLWAQESNWPTQTISIVSGFPGGAGTDTYARKLGTELGSQLNVAFISDNRTGAGGNIASSYVAKARPDGYTFLLGTAGTHAINPALYKNLSFDPVKDFSRIALLGNLPNVLLVNPQKHPNIKTCKDLLALIRKMPGELNYASTGGGTSSHLAAVKFGTVTQTRFVHVPYRGQGPAITSLLAGDVDFFFNQSSPSIPMVKAGKARALAVTSAQRIAALPDVPTAAEACDLPGFENTTWYGLFGPVGLPLAIESKMSKTVLATLKTENFRSWLVEQGIAPTEDGSPAAFKIVLEQDLVRWGKIVKDSGAQVD